jgi:hypothetical protein
LSIKTNAGHLDEGSDQLLAKAVYGQEPRPVSVEEVDQQSLDVRAVRILVGHDEDVAISQGGDVSIRIVFICIQPQGVAEADDLFVSKDAGSGVGGVDELPLNREDTIVFSADNLQS